MSIKLLNMSHADCLDHSTVLDLSLYISTNYKQQAPHWGFTTTALYRCEVADPYYCSPKQGFRVSVS